MPTMAEAWIGRDAAQIAEKRTLVNKEGVLVFPDGSGMKEGNGGCWVALTAEQVAETDELRQLRLRNLGDVFIKLLVKSAAETVKEQAQPLLGVKK